MTDDIAISALTFSMEIVSTKWGNERLVATATLTVGTEEELAEGLPELRNANTYELEHKVFQRDGIGACWVEITHRRLIYTGQEPIDFGAADPTCLECSGSGAVPLITEFSGAVTPCPCRKYDLSGVTEKEVRDA